MNKVSILIAEDESIIVLDLKSLLKKSGYKNIAVVNDGDALVKKALDEHPSLIISDVSLKGNISGINAANMIWEKQKVPFIFISGREIDKNVINSDTCEIVKKPYKGEEIINAIKKLTNHE